AETLGISGWVKNLRDGSVEALISGEDKQINKMLQWFHQGSPSSAVREVVVDEDARPPGNNQFLIQR
ncbi:MAG: acylphosphatase, partial [Desulfocapsaceae bacterium]|nr:acylphosphatase [Desulfocapsaceae bacterium]